ncbi:MAG: transcription antitermination protein NusB [Erysipelotrichaceae bacterium]
MNRRKIRENLMIATYSHLIQNVDVRICLQEKLQTNFDTLDEYLQQVAVDIVRNEKKYIEQLDGLIDEWEFDRLGKVEQALLIVGCSELNLNLVDKAIVIDEAVSLAKVYCDDEAYKLINATLDKCHG